MKPYLAMIEERITRFVFVEGDNIADAAANADELSDDYINQYEANSCTREVIMVKQISEDEAKEWR